MAAHGQAVQAKKVCQKKDRPIQEHTAGKTTPASWKLTDQQQAFIEMFSADDHKKQ
jgi:hypothetical protein